jgi:hypothetical protein
VIALSFLLGVFLPPSGVIIECDTHADPCDSEFGFAYWIPVILYLGVAVWGRTWTWYWIGVALVLPAALLVNFLQYVD